MNEDGSQALRLAILYVALPGYMVACLRALKSRYSVDLLVFHHAPAPDAPYTELPADSVACMVDMTSKSRHDQLKELEAFQPAAIYMVGWMDQSYLAIARQLKRRGIPVIAGCDRQWQGTLRQRLAQAIAPLYLHSAIDVLWVAGERQCQLAARLGYRGKDCWSGIYACDWDRFATAPSDLDQCQPAFLFVGRYVEEKGIEHLVSAYTRYRKITPNPWPLHCIGTGPLGHLLQGVEGVTDFGFVQPADLPAHLRQATVFVLPSVHEPWGVVVQEAAASRLALICSDACGAADHLLQPGENGELVAAGDAEALAGAMMRLAGSGPDKLRRMGEVSFELSKQYTPQKWAQTLVTGLRKLGIHVPAA